jgi:hypothetical protein
LLLQTTLQSCIAAAAKDRQTDVAIAAGAGGAVLGLYDLELRVLRGVFIFSARRYWDSDKNWSCQESEALEHSQLREPPHLRHAHVCRGHPASTSLSVRVSLTQLG